MYTRVFYRILDSSLNTSQVPVPARWLWLTMLLIADNERTGIVDLPIERLAARAGLTVEDTRAALAVLMAPDRDSTSDVEEGRRVLPLTDNPNRGWRLVNWETYRDIANSEHQKELTLRRVRRHREKNRVTETNRNDVKRSGNESVTTSETETESESKTETTPPLATLGPPGGGRNGDQPKRRGFTKPTLAEVRAHVAEKGYTVDPDRWYAHYEGNGWKVGKVPMANWKAVVFTWQKQRDEGGMP